MEYLNAAIGPSDPHTSTLFPEQGEWQQQAQSTATSTSQHHPSHRRHQQQQQQQQQLMSSIANTSLEDAMWRMTLEQPESIQMSTYPVRLGEPDCVYYMRTGLCGFGTNCKFNHPPDRRSVDQEDYPQRPGQPDCQFFLKTGSCRFGATCKYHHPADKVKSTQGIQLNILGLPLQPGEDCAYYMRTGHCKFGATCKFNHPQPMLSGPSSPVLSGFSPIGLVSDVSGSWASITQSSYVPSCLLGPPSFTPMLLPSPQVAVPWNAYQEMQQQQGLASASYLYGPVMPQQESMALSMYPFIPFPPSMMVPVPSSPAPGATPGLYPERPGQPDCQYYMKTGKCRFGPQCRYHHPRDRSAGLPVRPGVLPCTFYNRYGFCKFGSTCKFDHSSIMQFFGDASMAQYSMGVMLTPTTGDIPGVESPDFQRPSSLTMDTKNTSDMP